jgi:hypothetical protein
MVMCMCRFLIKCFYLTVLKISHVCSSLFIFVEHIVGLPLMKSEYIPSVCADTTFCHEEQGKLNTNKTKLKFCDDGLALI